MTRSKKSKPDPRQTLGATGEAEAERYLRGLGMKIAARRFRARTGEIDLVVLDGEQVVFVEVKTLRSMDRGRPASAVGERKRLRMARTALRFLAERGWHERVCRFDVVEVRGSREGDFRVHHIRDAFRL